MTPLSAYVEGIGFLGPGFGDWPSAVPVLAGSASYIARATVLPVLDVLPPAERRRLGRIVKLALAVGLEATSNVGERRAMLASVFSSSSGDGDNCHELCAVLATTDRQVSPTRFHNSVHNAAAGYWSIATGAKAPSNALCAYDASFAAGLLEALTQVVIDQTTVLLVSYDAQYREPLHTKRPIADALGVALVLAPKARASSIARLSAAFTDSPADRLRDAELEALRTSIPAARSLPLLRQLARREAARVTIDYLGAQRVAIEVAPCD
jgi:Beta-ketoacyl synthase, N-terminal domain